jgi:hypothetical protein
VTTLAIDAASTTGIAVVNGAELLHASVVMARSDTLQRLTLLQTLPRPDRVAIERPQLRTVSDDKASQGKAQGTLSVSRHVGMWQALCELAYPGVTVVHVYPATWRSALRFPAGDRKHLKALSLAAARARWPHVEWTSDDQSDAALMALAVDNTPFLWDPR